MTNSVKSPLDDLTDTVLDVAEAAFDAAGDLLAEAGASAGDLGGTALAIAAAPGVRKGVVKGGWKLLRRHPVVIVTALLAFLGWRYWMSTKDSDSADRRDTDESRS